MDAAKKFNTVVVSNSIEYADQLKRCARLSNNIVIQHVAKSATELRQKLNVHADVYIISNSLANGDTLSDVIGLLQSTDAVVVGLLTDKSQGELLNRFGIDYYLESDFGPMEFIEFLEESLMNYASGNTEEVYEEPQPVVTQREVNMPEPQPRAQATPQSRMQQPEVQQRSVSSFSQETIEPLNSTFREEVEPVSNQRAATPYARAGRGRTTLGLIKNKIVSFTSSKGGVGKSSISIEVASCIAQMAKQIDIDQRDSRGQSDKINVVLVDFNFAFGTIPSTLECVVQSKRQVTLADWAIAIENKILASMTNTEKKSLQGETNPNYIPYLKKMRRNDLIFSKQEILNLLIHDEITDLYVLPTVSSPFEVDNIKKEYIPIIIEELSRVFDIIIIDTGNNLSHFTSEAYYLSDEIYVVGQPLVSVTVILKQLLTSAINVLGVDADKFRLIVNHPNQSARGVEVESMEKQLEIPLVSEIPYDPGVGLAHESGRYYSIVNRKKKFSNEIALLANRICPLWQVNRQPKQSVGRRWFGK